MAFKPKTKASALPLRLRGSHIVNVSVEDQDTLYRDFLGRLPGMSFDTTAVICGLRGGVIVCKNAISDDGLNHSDLFVRFQFKSDFLTIEEIDARDEKVFSKWCVSSKGSIVDSIPVFVLEMGYGDNVERAQVVTATVLAILQHITVQRKGSSELRNESVSEFSMDVYRSHPKSGKKGKPKSREYFTMTVKIPEHFESASILKSISVPEVTWFDTYA